MRVGSYRLHGRALGYRYLYPSERMIVDEHSQFLSIRKFLSRILVAQEFILRYHRCVESVKL